MRCYQLLTIFYSFCGADVQPPNKFQRSVWIAVYQAFKSKGVTKQFNCPKKVTPFGRPATVYMQPNFHTIFIAISSSVLAVT